MTYRVVHRTAYGYDTPVSASYGETHLHPRETGFQQCFQAAVAVEPFPEHYRERRDFFGNRAAHFEVLEPHTELVVTATSLVEVAPRTDPAVTADRPWEQVVDQVRTTDDPDVVEARQFLLPSPGVPVASAAVAYVEESFQPGRPLADALIDVVDRLHREFEFAPGVTSVTTTVAEVMARRAGVCQDFAHLVTAGLRALGLPTRYVSGYLETDPPPGTPRLQGADVSHAWVSVLVPGTGWIDLDPTNHQFVNDRYVTVAWGRDYFDIPPVKGVIFSDGEGQRLEVTVDVAAVADDDPDLLAATA